MLISTDTHAHDTVSHELAHTTLVQDAAAYARECTGIVAHDEQGGVHHIVRDVRRHHSSLRRPL